MMDFIDPKAVAEASSVMCVGAIGYLYRLSWRFEVLERLFKEKKESLAVALAASADHEKRIAVVESVIAELKELTPALQNIATLTAKVETLLETSVKRLDMLENHVYKQ